MRKIITDALVAVALVGMLICLGGFAGSVDTHYKQEGIITEVCGDEVFVADSTGEVWSFYGEGYTKGDRVVLKMFTNYTDHNRADDVIQNVKIKR